MFAARLVQARALRGLSQRELGKRMGLGKDQGFSKNTGSSRVNRYEQGTNSLTLDNLDAVADALDVPPAYLVAETQGLADLVLVLGTEPLLVDALLTRARGPDVMYLVERLRSLLPPPSKTAAETDPAAPSGA